MRWSPARRWSPCMACSASDKTLCQAVNDLLLGSLLYQSRLVPRVLPLLGIIGAPLLIANTIVVMFGITTGPLYLLTGIGVLPIALFEFSLGVWLTVKGFDPSAVASLFAKTEMKHVKPDIDMNMDGRRPECLLCHPLRSHERRSKMKAIGAAHR